MTIELTPNNASWTNNAIPTLSAFASDLGIIVENGWPTEIQDTHFGNKQPLRPYSKKVVDGDLLYVRYCQQLGCLDLIVYND